MVEPVNSISLLSNDLLCRERGPSAKAVLIHYQLFALQMCILCGNGISMACSFCEKDNPVFSAIPKYDVYHLFFSGAAFLGNDNN